MSGMHLPVPSIAGLPQTNIRMRAGSCIVLKNYPTDGNRNRLIAVISSNVYFTKKLVSTLLGPQYIYIHQDSGLLALAGPGDTMHVPFATIEKENLKINKFSGTLPSGLKTRQSSKTTPHFLPFSAINPPAGLP